MRIPQDRFRWWVTRTRQWNFNFRKRRGRISWPAKRSSSSQGLCSEESGR